MIRTTRRSRTVARHRALAVALIAGALAAACGTDAPAPQYDCCINGLYYVCPNQLAAGNCISRPGDPSGCSFRNGLACPGTTANP